MKLLLKGRGEGDTIKWGHYNNYWRGWKRVKLLTKDTAATTEGRREGETINWGHCSYYWRGGERVKPLNEDITASTEE